MTTTITAITQTLRALGLCNTGSGRDFQVQYHNINGRREFRDVVLYGREADRVVRDNAERITAETGLSVTISKYGVVRIGG